MNYEFKPCVLCISLTTCQSSLFPYTIITYLQGFLVYKSTNVISSLEMLVSESMYVAIISRVSIHYGRLIWIINHRKGVRNRTFGRINCQEILSTESKIHESSQFYDTYIHITAIPNARHCVSREKLWISSGLSFLSDCYTLEHQRSPSPQVSLNLCYKLGGGLQTARTYLSAEACRLPGVPMEARRVSYSLQWNYRQL